MAGRPLSRRTASRLLLCAGFGGLAAGARAQTAPPPKAEPPFAEIALRIARDFVIPATEAFTKATRSQADAWRAFASAPQRATLPQLVSAFRAAADSWSSLEVVRYGPIGEDLRYERVAHWPERKGAVQKAVAGLLDGSEEITAERLRRASVAGQGLSALERLLFGEAEGGAAKAQDALLDPGPNGRRRRELGAAIAANLATIADETLRGWTAADGALARLQRADPDDAREAVTRLATDYLALLQAIADAKIGAVLGKDADEARPALAEGWRSGRSLQAIKLNLDAADVFSRAAVAHDAVALRAMHAALETPRAVAADLAAGGVSLSALANDPKRRFRLVLLRDAVLSARALSGPELADALKVTIGFNSRDGD